MDKIEFKDNTSTTPNRRRLKIIDNTNPLDMLVDIEHLSDSKNGDMITAQLLQRLEDNIHTLSQKITELEEENNAQSNLPQTSSGNGNSPKIYVNGEQASELSFTSNPQTQIDEMKTIVNNCNTIVSQVSANYQSIVTDVSQVMLQMQAIQNTMSTMQSEIQTYVTSQINALKQSAVVLDENNAMTLGTWKMKIDNNSGNLVFESSEA